MACAFRTCLLLCSSLCLECASPPPPSDQLLSWGSLLHCLGILSLPPWWLLVLGPCICACASARLWALWEQGLWLVLFCTVAPNLAHNSLLNKHLMFDFTGHRILEVYSGNKCYLINLFNTSLRCLSFSLFSEILCEVCGAWSCLDLSFRSFRWLQWELLQFGKQTPFGSGTIITSRKHLWWS